MTQNALRSHRSPRVGYTGWPQLFGQKLSRGASFAGRQAIRFWENPAFARVFAELEQVEHLEVDWDGDGALPPAPKALKAARAVLAASVSEKLVPRRVVPDGGGGVSIYYATGAKMVFVAISAEAKALLTLRDRAAHIHDIEDVKLADIEHSLKRIDRFIAA